MLSYFHATVFDIHRSNREQGEDNANQACIYVGISITQIHYLQNTPYETNTFFYRQVAQQIPRRTN